MKNWLLIFSILVSIHADARSFNKTAIRYPTPLGIIKIIRAKLAPDVGDLQLIHEDCKEVTLSNEETLGANKPLFGQPISGNPNVTFEIWFSGCVSQYLSEWGRSSFNNFFEEVFGKQLSVVTTSGSEEISKIEGLDSNEVNIPFSLMSNKSRWFIFNDIFTHLIGGEQKVIRFLKLEGKPHSQTDYQYYLSDLFDKIDGAVRSGDVNGVVRKEYNEFTIKDLIKAYTYLIAMSDYFLRI